jgi:hypothetical protein
MGALPRTVGPEILDTLDPADPGAVRSRLDLRRIDLVLGGTRWVLRSARAESVAANGLVELGAGDGRLCSGLARHFPDVLGLDFAPRPDRLPPAVAWRSGDFFQTLPEVDAGVLVGSLILHHFSPVELGVLGRLLQPFRVLLFSEPLRSRWPLVFSALVHPLLGTVTRHDMPASIRAGFQPGELAPLLGLDSGGWHISESAHRRGMLRFKAWRD